MGVGVVTFGGFIISLIIVGAIVIRIGNVVKELRKLNSNFEKFAQQHGKKPA